MFNNGLVDLQLANAGEQLSWLGTAEQLFGKKNMGQWKYYMKGQYRGLYLFEGGSSWERTRKGEFLDLPTWKQIQPEVLHLNVVFPLLHTQINLLFVQNNHIYVCKTQNEAAGHMHKNTAP